jgi:hypothetical protein
MPHITLVIFIFIFIYFHSVDPYRVGFTHRI